MLRYGRHFTYWSTWNTTHHSEGKCDHHGPPRRSKSGVFQIIRNLCYVQHSNGFIWIRCRLEIRRQIEWWSHGNAMNHSSFMCSSIDLRVESDSGAWDCVRDDLRFATAVIDSTDRSGHTHFCWRVTCSHSYHVAQSSLVAPFTWSQQSLPSPPISQ